jgi:hypothetical protein
MASPKINEKKATMMKTSDLESVLKSDNKRDHNKARTELTKRGNYGKEIG